MKKFIFFSAIALWLFMMVGCSKEQVTNYKNVNLVYERCTPIKNRPMSGTIHKKDILLFNADYIEEREIVKLLTPQYDRVEYAIYDASKNVGAYSYVIFKRLRVKEPGGNECYYVCNFPNEIKKWDIPKTGLLITFSGDLFKPLIEIGLWEKHYYIVLTSLKIEEK